MSIVFKTGFIIALLLMGVGAWFNDERWADYVFRWGCVLFAMTYLAVDGVANW